MSEGRSALICENDPVQLKILRAVFDRAGYTTSGARSPVEALRQLEERRADLIVSDFLLDEGNAFDLLGGARRMGLDAPMIMISAYATDTLRAHAFREGVATVLEKMPGYHELMACAGKLVGEARPRGRMLLVEAQDGGEALLLPALAKAGFRTFVARDARAARAALAEGPDPVDMVLVDLRIPEAAGLIRDLKEAVPGLSVAALEGAGNPSSIRAAYQAGAVKIFGSPLRSEHVAGTLAGDLNRAREARRVAAGQSRFARAVGVCGRRKVRRGMLLAAAGLLAGVLTGFLVDRSLGFVERSSERADRIAQLMEARLLAPYGVQPATGTWASPPPAADAWGGRSPDFAGFPGVSDGDGPPRPRILMEPAWNQRPGGSEWRR